MINILFVIWRVRYRLVIELLHPNFTVHKNAVSYSLYPSFCHLGEYLFSSVIVNSFSTNPESQTVNEGTTLLLFCVGVSHQLPSHGLTTALLSPLPPVFSYSRPCWVTLSLHGSLAPWQLPPWYVTSDAGMYRCVATNVLFPGSDEATIAVGGKRIRSKLFVVYFYSNCDMS